MAVTFLTNEDEKIFVKSINNVKPDRNGNVEITINSQDVDLTGYATEEWVQEGYQTKGSYLTKVPDGYATEKFVTDKISEAELNREEVDLSGYVKKSELPTKVSQLDNDKGFLTEHQDISGKLDANKLPEAINTALAQAKDSGEFDGYTPIKGVDYFDGTNGTDGKTPEKGVDYFTEADKTEIAQQAADLVDISDLEEVYILSENETLSDVPDGITVVIDPDGNSDFDLSKYVKTSELNSAINTALTSAKNSGEFDGKDGKDGYTPQKGIDYLDGTDYVLTAADKDEIIETVKAKVPLVKVVEQPAFANSVEECTDTSKAYLLPDGHLYAYMKTPNTATKLTAEDFEIGGLNSTGGDYGSDIRARSGQIECTVQRPITITCNVAGIKWLVHFFKDGTWIGKTNMVSTSSDDIASLWTTPDDVTHVRFLIGYTSDKAIASLEDLVGGFTIKKIKPGSIEWADTGLSYNQPADYENRVIAMEKELEVLLNGTF